MLSSGGNMAAGTALAAAGLGVGALALRRRRAHNN
jgi:MYXO-CTERM domain-containing protein